MQQDLQHMPAGVSHGSLLIKNCSEESPEPAHHDVPDNRDRFAMLAVLFGWTHARDRQFIYSLTVPPLVYSVDHSHFLHGDPFWSTATLEAAPRARISRDIVEKCGLDADSLRIALGRLSAVGSHVIAEAVSRPPDSWSVTLDERVAAALYLDKRKSELLNDPRFRGLNDGS